MTGPISFSAEPARNHLTLLGMVHTVRAEDRTTGETWARWSRLGPKRAEVLVERVGRPREVGDLAEWAETSGFGSSWQWWRAVEELHGGLQGTAVYRVELLDSADD